MMTFKLLGVRTKQKTFFFDCGGQENSFDAGGKKIVSASFSRDVFAGLFVHVFGSKR